MLTKMLSRFRKRQPKQQTSLQIELEFPARVERPSDPATSPWTSLTAYAADKQRPLASPVAHGLAFPVAIFRPLPRVFTATV